MSAPLQIDVITIFPQMLSGFLNESILKRAQQAQAVSFNTIDLRNFTHDSRRTTDDKPYGGGPGMLMKPEPIFEAVESVCTPKARVILTSPQGKMFNQNYAEALAQEKHLVFICGHYEGVDERVSETLVTDEISIGDYVLTNGVLPAAVVIDALVRLQPGVLGAEQATTLDSFTTGMLEHPQYTRPAEYRNMKVPNILLTGNHGEISKWQKEQALKRTQKRRPDLLI
ncbi:MAG: tRNA (guanosine(37)-N1)-methyltransferase TrmD [Kiritimatiellae bacterium]|nr:tRNA (guanosine(37)-N1)-methyltransferase TrmD [Kiritimatiellia bacterium]